MVNRLIFRLILASPLAYCDICGCFGADRMMQTNTHYHPAAGRICQLDSHYHLTDMIFGSNQKVFYFHKFIAPSLDDRQFSFTDVQKLIESIFNLWINRSLPDRLIHFLTDTYGSFMGKIVLDRRDWLGYSLRYL